MSVFIDSGAFVAALFRSDRHHQALRAMFLRPPKRSFTSVLVLSETYSWFLHKLDEEAAREFLAFLDALDGLVILDVPAALREDARRLLDRLRGRKLTYVDAASLVLIERRVGELAQVIGQMRRAAQEAQRDRWLFPKLGEIEHVGRRHDASRATRPPKRQVASSDACR